MIVFRSLIVILWLLNKICLCSSVSFVIRYSLQSLTSFRLIILIRLLLFSVLMILSLVFYRLTPLISELYHLVMTILFMTTLSVSISSLILNLCLRKVRTKKLNDYKFFSGCHVPCGRDRGIFSSAGCKVRVEYAERFNPKTGQPELFPIGKTDLVELHNADKESCDIATLVRRYQTGDVSALSQTASAFYADITQLPKDSIEAANRQLFARQLFDRLPVNVKETYGNSYVMFLKAFNEGDEKALGALGVKIQKNEPVKESEVVNNESKQE